MFITHVFNTIRNILQSEKQKHTENPLKMASKFGWYENDRNVVVKKISNISITAVIKMHTK